MNNFGGDLMNALQGVGSWRDIKILNWHLPFGPPKDGGYQKQRKGYTICQTT